MSSSELTPECFERLRKFIHENTGIAVADGKSYLIETRFKALLEEESIESFESFCDTLEKGVPARLLDKIVNAITTNETLWFRDDGPWQILEKNLLPQFCEQLTTGKRDKIRIWSAASATGQEPYSVAMLIREFIEGIPDIKPESFEILATDISSDAIATSKAAEYELLAASRGISPDRLEQFFDESEGSVQVKQEIRSMVRFQQFDLQRSFMGLGEFDLVLCRNVLIYFANDLKKEIYEKISRTLTEDGALILGGAESIQGTAKLFKMARAGRFLYYTSKKKGAS